MKVCYENEWYNAEICINACDAIRTLLYNYLDIIHNFGTDFSYKEGSHTYRISYVKDKDTIYSQESNSSGFVINKVAYIGVSQLK